VEARSAAVKETYYQRWRRLHPKVTFYLKKETYERLKEAAASRNMTVKDFVLSLVEGFERYYDEVKARLSKLYYSAAAYAFVERPAAFLGLLERYYPEGSGRELAFFTLPCSICGQRMVFNHGDENWAEVRRVLLDAFRGWGHACCHEVRMGEKSSCEHLPRGFGGGIKA
jgi:hypothetical protein